MNVSAIVRQYARALADVALEEKAQDAVTRDLEALVSAFQMSSELAAALKNPAVPQEQKMVLLQALWERSGALMSPLSRNFFATLISNGRLSLLEQIVAAYQTLVDERLGIVSAEVTTRFALRDQQKSMLAQRLEAVTGKRAKLSFLRDDALIGGVILRIGSIIYDGSVRRQLQAIRARLASE